MNTRDAFVTAVLGPTNTGKTYYALERMLSFRSGIIGFPLRLLARENFDKLVAKCGPQSVALLTGEEKIVPRNPKYWVCTVESMPLDMSVEFIGVDEIQLAADPERGHIFTHRLLHARGMDMTMFMGSSTIEPLIRRLISNLEVINKGRFSQLTYVNPKKLSKVPKRSAIVAFSAQEVYATADIIRRHRGGAAVVLGALSPRTRNAQVEMFQAGEVDFLVATDAIGMGLNMDLDHVTFTKLSKFDGKHSRRLTPAEVGQIAGRAGRYTNDGTFCMTTELGDLDPELVDAVENHRFDPLEQIVWRNPNLDFYDMHRLLKSLDSGPPSNELIKGREADDQRALRYLAKDDKVRDLARGPAAVGILWEVCQVPDFHKTMTDSHVKLLSQIYQYLMSMETRIPEDWIAAQVLRLDDIRGDIDTLTNRLASIRTWTFISHRRHWLENNSYWQEKTREIEDHLSDALHERLTLQFVDQRAATLMKAREQASVAQIEDNKVSVEGQYVGDLAGLQFKPIAALEAKDARSFLTVAKTAMAEPVQARLAEMLTPSGSVYKITDDGKIMWHEVELGYLTPSQDKFAPKLKLTETNMIDQPQRDQLQDYVEQWVHREIRQRLATLISLRDATLSGAAKGLAFQLVENFGCCTRDAALEQVTPERSDRKALKDLGVIFGRHNIWVGNLVKPRNRGLRAMLWSLAHPDETAPEVPSNNLTLAPFEDGQPESFWLAMGFQVMKNGDQQMVFRADILDNFANAAFSAGRKADKGEAAMASRMMLTLIGGDTEVMRAALRALAYRVQDKIEVPEGETAPAEETAAAEATTESVEAAAEAAPAEEPSAEGVAEAAPAEVAEPEAPEPEATAPVAEDAKEAAPEAEDAKPEEAKAEEGAEASAEAGTETAEKPKKPAKPNPLDLDPVLFRFPKREWQPKGGGRPRREANEGGEQARSDKPGSSNPGSDKPRGERPQGDRSAGDRPRGDRKPRQDAGKASGKDGERKSFDKKRGPKGKKPERQSSNRVEAIKADSPFAALAGLKDNLKKK